MVSSEDREASEWGVEMLRRGGNAVDAAVATAFYLSVSRPYYAALGGGGFMVYCPAPKKGTKQNCTTLDFRETAPAAAKRDMYLINGQAKPELSEVGPLAIATPGNVDGYTTAVTKYGRLRLAKLLERPIKAAINGVPMTAYLAERLNEYWKTFSPTLQKNFSCGKSAGALRPCKVREKIVQNDLARVLTEISRKGRSGFYEGWVAQKIAADIKKAGGILSVDDLKNFHSKERAAVVGNYQDLEIVGMPPPSSGGLLMLQLFRYLDLARQDKALVDGFGSASTIHSMATAMSLAFADRKEYLGDPEFSNVPVSELSSKTYLDARWKKYYSPSKFTLAETTRLEPARSGINTTHISAIDAEGNAVSMTITVNSPYGSGFMPEGTGLVMNNEMNDFNVLPATGDRFALVSGARNEIAPGKRPLSSMSPTIVRDATTGMPEIVIGGQGGPYITTAVFSTLVNRLVFGMSIVDSVIAARVHHQWKPNVLQMESNSFGIETINALKKKGHEIKIIDFSARLHALERLPSGEVWGAADPRTEGSAVAE